MDTNEARNFLAALLGKNLRITVADDRVFRGQFQCTDTDSNAILANTYEYRAVAPKAGSKSGQDSEGGSSPAQPDMTARYVGLVIVPGKHIEKIEVEEFRSQIRGSDLSGEYRPTRY